MIKLSEKQRAEAKELLGDYQTTCDMINDVGRRMFSLTITSESDANDFSELVVSSKNAKVLLEAEKEQTILELKKLGIEAA